MKRITVSSKLGITIVKILILLDEFKTVHGTGKKCRALKKGLKMLRPCEFVRYQILVMYEICGKKIFFCINQVT